MKFHSSLPRKFLWNRPPETLDSSAEVDAVDVLQLLTLSEKVGKGVSAKNLLSFSSNFCIII